MALACLGSTKSVLSDLANRSDFRLGKKRLQLEAPYWSRFRTPTTGRLLPQSPRPKQQWPPHSWGGMGEVLNRENWLRF